MQSPQGPRLTQNNGVIVMQTMRRNPSMQNRMILIQCDRALQNLKTGNKDSANSHTLTEKKKTFSLPVSLFLLRNFTLCDPNFSQPKIVICIDGNYKVVYVLLTLMHCSDSLSSFSCLAYTEHSSWSASACLRHITQKYFRYINSHYGCNMQPLTRFCVLFHLSYWTTVLHFDASY